MSRELAVLVTPGLYRAAGVAGGSPAGEFLDAVGLEFWDDYYTTNKGWFGEWVEFVEEHQLDRHPSEVVRAYAVRARFDVASVTHNKWEGLRDCMVDLVTNESVPDLLKVEYILRTALAMTDEGLFISLRGPESYNTARELQKSMDPRPTQEQFEEMQIKAAAGQPLSVNEAMMRELAQAVSRQDLSDPERVYLYAAVESWVDFIDGPKPEVELAAIFSPGGDIDPWIREAVLGRLLVDRAWDVRGNKFSSKTSDMQFKGFREHLQEAAVHLRKAYELNPRLAGPCHQMIKVCMGGGGGPDEDEYLWFSRAVKYQPDTPGPYNALRYALEPKWGGSIDQMVQLVLLWASPQFEDDPTPVQSLLTLGAIMEVLDERRWLLLNIPSIQLAIDRTLKALKPETVHGYARRTAMQFETLYRVVRGERDRALELVTQSKGNFGISESMWFGLSGRSAGDLALELCYGERNQVAGALDAESERDWTTAHVRWAEVLSETPDDDPLRVHIESRFMRAGVSAELEAARTNGNWVSVPSRSTMITRHDGIWSDSDEGTLIGTSYRGWVRAMLALPIEDPVEIRAEFRVRVNAFTNAKAGFAFGGRSDFGERSEYMSVRLMPSQRLCFTGDRLGSEHRQRARALHEEIYASPDGKHFNSLHIASIGTKVRATIGEGEQAETYEWSISDPGFVPGFEIGFVGSSLPDNAGIEVRNIQMRYLPKNVLAEFENADEPIREDEVPEY